jgi:hypothetical protein
MQRKLKGPPEWILRALGRKYVMGLKQNHKTGEVGRSTPQERAVVAKIRISGGVEKH